MIFKRLQWGREEIPRWPLLTGPLALNPSHVAARLPVPPLCVGSVQTSRLEEASGTLSRPTLQMGPEEGANEASGRCQGDFPETQRGNPSGWGAGGTARKNPRSGGCLTLRALREGVRQQKGQEE